MRATRRHRNLVLLPLLLPGACSSPEGGSGDARFSIAGDVQVDTLLEPARRELEGRVQVVMGGEDGPPAAVFSDIASVAIDSAKRIFVADRLADQVKVFDLSGELQFVLGRSGKGPGELLQPSDLAIDPLGRLWVRDGGRGRLSVFKPASGMAVFEYQIPSYAGTSQTRLPIGFPEPGVLVDVWMGFDRRIERMALSRRVIDLDSGDVLRVEKIQPPSDDLVPILYRSAGPLSGSYFVAPSGPVHLTAHATNGDWAEAVSSRYVVLWHAAGGGVRKLYRPIGEGPPLSTLERNAVRASRERIRQMAGTEAPGPFPERHPPLAGLQFDSDGNLWVHLKPAEGEDNRADVIAPDGTYLASVSWPREVNALDGAVGVDIIAGVLTGRYGEERLALVQLGSAPLPIPSATN